MVDTNSSLNVNEFGHLLSLPPARYTDRYKSYQMRGGRLRIGEMIEAYVHDGGNAGDMSRLYSFCLAFDQISKEGIAGDFAELGVYRGNTAKLLALMARWSARTAWLLDTYEGFDPGDLQTVDAGHAMEFSDTSLEAVRAFVGEKNTRFIKGHFPDSTSQLPHNNPYSLVHIDCDLYKPMLAALEYFYPRMAPGGYLMLHDYGALCWDGAELAIDEFFADKPEAILTLPDTCTTAIVRKARTPVYCDDWLIRKRCGLFDARWTTAADDGLRLMLDSGWSGIESWGVYGIDHVHTMNIYIARKPDDEIAVHFDVAAELSGVRQEQRVDVVIGDKCVATWEFTREHNRSEQIIIVSPKALEFGRNGCGMIRFAFRPHYVARICDVDVSSSDARQAGLALYGIRRGGSART